MICVCVFCSPKSWVICNLCEALSNSQCRKIRPCKQNALLIKTFFKKLDKWNVLWKNFFLIKTKWALIILKRLIIHQICLCVKQRRISSNTQLTCHRLLCVHVCGVNVCGAHAHVSVGSDKGLHQMPSPISPHFSFWGKMSHQAWNSLSV